MFSEEQVKLAKAAEEKRKLMEEQNKKLMKDATITETGLGYKMIKEGSGAQATKGKMVYPSVDPSVFEIKFPNKDIKGRVV